MLKRMDGTANNKGQQIWQILQILVRNVSNLLAQKDIFFWEFPGILVSFWRILDISKRIFQIFSGNSGNNFRPYFGNYVAKPTVLSRSKRENPGNEVGLLFLFLNLQGAFPGNSSSGKKNEILISDVVFWWTKEIRYVHKHNRYWLGFGTMWRWSPLHSPMAALQP